MMRAILLPNLNANDLLLIQIKQTKISTNIKNTNLILTNYLNLTNLHSHLTLILADIILMNIINKINLKIKKLIITLINVALLDASKDSNNLRNH